MSERITTGVQRLFEVRVLHHYWLDEGATVFDLMPSQHDRDTRLLEYDVQRFLDAKPTDTTKKLLDSLGCAFVKSNMGFIIAAPQASALPKDAVFTFMLTVREQQIFDYTALTLSSRGIYECYYEPEKTLYRYKENVPSLSNSSGSTREIPAGNTLLFLSGEIPAPSSGDLIESIIQSGGALQQLISDDHGIAPQQLGPDASALPVYLNQGDVKGITPPAGLSGAPAKGIRLVDGIPDDTFALISLSAVVPANDLFSFVDAGGNAKTPPPVYQVRLKNRSTFWNYLDKSTSAVISTEAAPLPLTFFGNAGDKQKPTAGFVKPELNGTAVNKLVSDVYV